MEQNPLIRRGVGLRGVDHSAVSPGYALFAHLTSPGEVRMVDNDGNEVHSWKLPYRPGRHARILPNGNLAYNGVHPDAPRLFPMWQKYRGGVMMQVKPDGKIISEYRDPLAHHDQNHLDDGTLLYLALEAMTDEEAQSVEGGIPNSEAYDGKIYADTIKHVDPITGKLLWKWRTADHLDRKTFPLQPIYAREHYPLINAVSFLRDGNVLASLRSVSAVIIICKQTGKVIWHLDSTIVAQQHCATELANGNILIFDNGALRHHTSAVFSRVIEVERATQQIVWQYVDREFPMGFYTPFMGSAQRLKNGNTFICEAAFGRMFEVTPEGRTVWEYINPHLANYDGLDAKELEDIGFDYPSNALFRAYKYTPDECPWLSLPSPAATP